MLFCKHLSRFFPDASERPRAADNVGDSKIRSGRLVMTKVDRWNSPANNSTCDGSQNLPTGRQAGKRRRRISRPSGHAHRAKRRTSSAKHVVCLPLPDACCLTLASDQHRGLNGYLVAVRRSPTKSFELLGNFSAPVRQRRIETLGGPRGIVLIGHMGVRG